MNPESLKQMIANCRHKDGRFLGFPRDWCPSRIDNPAIPGFCFTEAGAWDFIADTLEGGHPYLEKVLDTPAGALAIEFEIELHADKPKLYVKVQLGKANKAIGRSFHYSDSYKRG
jgi:hypothetical protein